MTSTKTPRGALSRIHRAIIAVGMLVAFVGMTGCGSDSGTTTTGAGGTKNDPFVPDFKPDGTNNPTKPIDLATS